VGPAAALAGVFIRTGSVIASTGERVVSGLVQRFGSLDFVSDNAGCFGNRPLPRSGSFINFSADKVYVVINTTCVYPVQVHVAADPPAIHAGRGRQTARCASVEVMMTAPGADAGKGIAGDANTLAKAPRARGPPLERAENLGKQADTLGVMAKPTYLQAAIKKLAMLVSTGTDALLT
jgi:hypothetical protein